MVLKCVVKSSWFNYTKSLNLTPEIVNVGVNSHTPTQKYTYAKQKQKE